MSYNLLRNLVTSNGLVTGGACNHISGRYVRHLSSLGQYTQSQSKLPTSDQFGKTFSCRDANFKILPPVSYTDVLGSYPLSGSNIELADLECNIPSRKTLVFNLSWLRDSCHCEKCTHKFSRQRLFTPKDFTRQVFEIADVQLVSSDNVQGYRVPSQLTTDFYLNIFWTDGHTSFYSLDWLESIHNLYGSPILNPKSLHPRTYQFKLPRDDLYSALEPNEAKIECWNVSHIESNIAPIDYTKLIERFEFHDDEPSFINSNRVSDMTQNRFESMLNLTTQLTKFGLAKIVNVPLERDQVLKVARSLAYERPTGYGTVFDVVVEPSEDINLAYSAQEFDLHSDLTYREKSPGVQMLHCISNSVDGGLSYFSDAFNAAKQLREESPKLFKVLLEFPATFVVRDPYRNTKFRRQKQILSLDQQGDLFEVYYSPFMLPAVGHRNDLKLFYLALDRYTQLLQAEDNKLIIKMDPGDLFIFHNRRVLHGRSSYDPTTGNRFLQGCYMDWDEIECLYEKLRSYQISVN